MQSLYKTIIFVHLYGIVHLLRFCLVVRQNNRLCGNYCCKFYFLNMCEFPFSFFLSDKLAIVHPEENHHLSGVEKIRLGKRVRKSIINVNGIHWYVCCTLRTLRVNDCSFTLELARYPCDSAKNVEMYLSVWNTTEHHSLKLDFFQTKFQSGEMTVSLTEDYNFNFTGKILLFQFHGAIRIDDIPAIITPKAILEEEKQCFVQHQNLYKISGTFSALNKLSEDFQKYFADSNDTDVAFKCGSDILYAHKLILSARSPVFKELFKNQMLESTTVMVEIEDISAQTFHTLLIYVYTGKIDILTISTACEGLYAAEKYQQYEMKQACISFLKCSLTNDVVLSVLTFADVYDNGLKQYVIDYICRNFHCIQMKESWKEFEKKNQSLAIEVLKTIINFTQT